MQKLHFLNPKGYLYVVTDSHLDTQTVPYQEFIEMLLNLEQPHTVVCLGDLFKVWLALPKFWADLNYEVMSAFQTLKDRGVNVIFVAGNRELLLPRNAKEEQESRLPFTHFFADSCMIQWGDLRYGFTHGDTINQHDRNYLGWRAFAHSPLFEEVFRMMPAKLAHWIADYAEEKLSGTNQNFKMSFPEAEVLRFAETVLPEVDAYFVGHFHTDRTLKLSEHSGFLKIVSDWAQQRVVLKITTEGELEYM